jgi:hypothetical protein
VFGEYLDALPGRWLVWHGRGPLGPTRYACGEHRGEPVAYLREHYGTIAWHPWRMPPYATTRSDTERAIARGGLLDAEVGPAVIAGRPALIGTLCAAAR